MMKKIVLFMVIMVVLALMTGCNSEKEKSAENNGEAQEETVELLEYSDVTIVEKDACSYDEAVSAGVKAMTLEDVQRLNNNNCTVAYNDKGKISFINGMYTDYKVSNVQEAYNSLMAVQGLLDLPMESIVPVKIIREDNIGTYYMFGKLENDSFQNGFGIHVITDAKNTVQGLGIGYGDGKYEHEQSTANNPSGYSSNEFFEGLVAEEATAKDSEGKAVTIPVMYSKEQDTYYMGDLERRIVVDVWDGNILECEISPSVNSKDNTWDYPQAVTALKSMIEVYDFFAKEMGFCSTDGSGIPIVLNMNRSKVLQYSARYSGVNKGMACFDVSEDSKLSSWLFAREFTRGIFEAGSMGYIYANDTGSINEGIADVFAALAVADVEKYETVDWFVKEEVLEAQGFYSICPDSVASVRYQVPAANPNVENDMGGVTYNAALLIHLANGLEQNQGLTREEQLKLWKTTLSFMISDENYAVLKQQMLVAAKLHGHEEWCEKIEQEFENLGFPKEITTDYWMKSEKEGYGRLIVRFDYDEEKENVQIDVIKKDDKSHYNSNYKSISGEFISSMPVGTYDLRILCKDSSSDKISRYLKDAIKVEIKEGENTVIENIPEEGFVVP